MGEISRQFSRHARSLLDFVQIAATCPSAMKVKSCRVVSSNHPSPKRLQSRVMWTHVIWRFSGYILASLAYCTSPRPRNWLAKLTRNFGHSPHAIGMLQQSNRPSKKRTCDQMLIGVIASLWRRIWPFGATPEIPAPNSAVKIEMRNQGSQRDIVVGRNVRLWLLADIQPHPELRPLYPRKRTYRGPMSAPGAIADHLQSGGRTERLKRTPRRGRERNVTYTTPG